MAVRILSGSSRIRVANTKKSADAHRSKGWIFLPGIGNLERLEIIAFKCCLFAIYRRDGFFFFFCPCNRQRIEVLLSFLSILHGRKLLLLWRWGRDSVR